MQRLMVNGHWVEIVAMFWDAVTAQQVAEMPDGRYATLTGETITRAESLAFLPEPHRTRAMRQVVGAPAPTGDRPATLTDVVQAVKSTTCKECGKTAKSYIGLMGHMRSHRATHAVT